MSGGAANAIAVIWLVVTIVCLAWGIYIRKRHRVLSWICIIYTVVQLGLLCLPFILPPSSLLNNACFLEAFQFAAAQ
jgi:endonuclease/exonuclease/phosphatase (EEP) superfamily protein YafD